MDSAQRFLIVNPFGIGDVLFTTPLVAALKAAYPYSDIDYWCNERVRGLFKYNPDVREVFALSRGDLKKIFERSLSEGVRKSIRLTRQLRRGRYQTVFDFSMDHRYGLACKLLGFPRRIGYDYRGRGRFLTDSLPIEGFEGKHVAEYYLDLLRFLGITPASGAMVLKVPERARIKSRILLHSLGVKDNERVVGIVPGAGASWGKNAHYKHWPALRFAQLADRLIEECGVRVALMGDSSEQMIADSIFASMRHKAVHLVGKTSLEDFAALLSTMSVCVGNDGGPIHMAVALDIPTVSLFGPVDDVVYGPYPRSGRHAVITLPMECRPCYKKFRVAVCDRERACIAGITTDSVFSAVRSRL
jgi:lipopolysaccharide heptosyltransferase II